MIFPYDFFCDFSMIFPIYDISDFIFYIYIDIYMYIYNYI